MARVSQDDPFAAVLQVVEGRVTNSGTQLATIKRQTLENLSRAASFRERVRVGEVTQAARIALHPALPPPDREEAFSTASFVLRPLP